MKNIHIIPTEKPSRLIIYSTLLNEFRLLNEPIEDWKHKRHIYITSDEEIKRGDWFYNTISLKPEPFKACENGDGYVNCSRYSHNRIDCKKIILTTDQSLDSIQAIDDEFLEWFVKNPSCERVEIKTIIVPFIGIGYKIIIPKEEPKQESCEYIKEVGCIKYICTCNTGPKQETLEEAAENYTKDGTKHFMEKTNVELGFKEGAKWQQEQDNKVPKILESLLEENYDLNIQFHKSMRESIFCFAVAMYDEKLPFKEWEKKYYGNYIEQPKHQQERSYSEEEVLDILFTMSVDNPNDITKWFEQFKK